MISVTTNLQSSLLNIWLVKLTWIISDHWDIFSSVATGWIHRLVTCFPKNNGHIWKSWIWVSIALETMGYSDCHSIAGRRSNSCILGTLGLETGDFLAWSGWGFLSFSILSWEIIELLMMVVECLREDSGDSSNLFRLRGIISKMKDWSILLN